MTNGPRQLRALIAGEKVLQVPGVYDGITARIAAEAGFEAISITGNALAASMLGVPDVGLTTLTEVVAAARNIAATVNIPVIADADTGYGSVVNVTRTIREFERAGVAGIHMEDQVTPKRCGLVSMPIPVVSESEFVAKIRAAAWARHDPEFVIIARTDAMSTLGLDEAIHRANAYLAVGADAAMIVGPKTASDIRLATSSVNGPLAIVMDERGEGGDLTAEQLTAMGLAIAVYAGVARYTVVKAVQTSLARLRHDGHTRNYRDLMAPFEEWNRVVGFDDYVEIERRFS
ncbi:MAG: oxaloacetate decarboxylase [Chloroflexota bacterium]